MRWLFLFLLFDTSADGMRPIVRISAVFQSEQECNELGRRAQREYEYEDNSLRSFSICIPESAYDEREMQVQDFREERQ